MRINRLELLKANLGLDLISGYADIEQLYDRAMHERATEEFYRQAGILQYLPDDLRNRVDTIVGASFNGATWSQRLWVNQSTLRASLGTLLTNGLIQGRNPLELSRLFRQQFDVAKKNADRLFRTELTRVQIDAQIQSFEANGYEEYMFISTEIPHRCSICADRAGKIYKIKDYAAGDNAPPMHPNCRCSTAAYMRGPLLDNDDSFKLKNNLPKGFIDERNIGTQINERELADFMAYAQSKGIRVGTADNPSGNFDLYHGDIKVLYEYIDSLAKYNRDVILMYDNVLGYEGDISKIDIGAFAITKGKTITLNKFMFDDTEYMIKQYESAVADGVFAAGTSYKNVVDHEVKHIGQRKEYSKTNKLLEYLQSEAESSNMTLDQYISVYISAYAGIEKNGFYYELVPELNSMLNGQEHEKAATILNEAGVTL